MSTKTQVEWRRAKVLEMISKGNSQTEIAGILQVDLSIISRDVSYLRQQAKHNIKKYIDERLPEEYEKCLVGLTSILREAWNTATNTEDKREKIHSRDVSYLRQQAKHNIKKYIDEPLPEEYEKCLVGLTSILKEAWNTATNTEDKREKIQALSLAKECYGMKLELLTNATVVDDAIRFVSEKQRQHSSKETRLKINDDANCNIEEAIQTMSNTTTNHTF